MYSHEFIKKISYILAGENADQLFHYLIHSMDQNGSFLRTRYCFWEEAIADEELGIINTALVTLRKPFDFTSSTQYYEQEEITQQLFCLAKMQIFLYDLSEEDKFMEEVQWAAAVGFSYPVKIDMVHETYEILPEEKLRFRPKRDIDKPKNLQKYLAKIEG